MKTTTEQILKALKEVKKEKGEIEDTVKEYNDCQTVEDWLTYYKGASRMELKSLLKSLGDNHLTTVKNNKRKAIKTLL